MKEITTDELLSWKKSGKKFVLLDARAEDYFHWERISGSQNLRWKLVKQFASKHFPDKEQVIVTACQSLLCTASTKAAEAFEELGYANIYEYSGGLSEWLAYGLPVEQTSEYHVAPQTYRFPNQIFYESAVGSYLIEDDDSLVIVDGPQQLDDGRLDFILSFNKPIKIFLTHGPTAGAANLLQERHGAQVFLHKADKKNSWLTIKPDVLFDKEFSISKNIRVLFTPGHSPGSSSLFDERSKIVFTGDQLAGVDNSTLAPYEKSMRDRGPRSLWDESVQKVAALKPTMLLPFHYSMILNGLQQTLEQNLK